jgi:cell wall-associated NlpC family hydrolase
MDDSHDPREAAFSDGGPRKEGCFVTLLRMRCGVWLLVLGVLGAVLGVASARASGAGATTTTGTTATAETTTTAGPTTTTTSTTTSTPSYAPLATSSLGVGCVGGGVAAVMLPSHRVVALGTPASDLGPSGYPALASVVAFSSSSVIGSVCRKTKVTLASVSLLGGAVTASSVEGTDGKGTVAGLEIGGVAVSATAGQAVRVEGWGRLKLDGKVSRLTAPLILRLLQRHDGLSAGTRIVIAFSAGPQPVATPGENNRSSPSMYPSERTSAEPRRHRKGATKKKRRRRQPAKPPPDFPASPSPFAKGGGFTDATRDNPAVSIAMSYLGIPYQWGGARPSTGFDCSGLVKYVFGKLGVPLVHYAAAQWHSPGGVWIPPDRLQPGDLVFFTGSDGTRKAPGHVGIYIDDGYFIDAPHTGSFVRVDSLDEPKFADEYVGARQVVSQRLAARHLSSVTKSNGSATAFPLAFPSPIRPPVGESLGIAAAGAALARAPSHDYWIWAGVALGGLLLLLVPGGAFACRRRRHAPDAVQSGELSS